ncbi:uncharacterized protein LOC111022103 [Momordica charantia]|uniref:Uncharacterized protein LOC111022103 n=1 Tax=Momordica charantia TaxID=3673 RepID=A0A6J1DL39_MOMCH|nr:uncharacterized protein LOC111022103 [Momordica charantia]
MNDTIVIGSQTRHIEELIKHLSTEFALKDLGPLHYFLKVEVHMTSTDLMITQEKYAKEILNKANMLEATQFSTPIAISNSLSPNDHEKVDATEYRSVVGSLQYLTLTRPDIQFAVNKVCQHRQEPTLKDLKAVKCIL